jgi:hypothetical protein
MLTGKTSFLKLKINSNILYVNWEKVFLIVLKRQCHEIFDPQFYSSIDYTYATD